MMEKTAMLSAGIDLGTSTTQLVISRLTVRNTASSFAVPKLSITAKEVVYRSEIHFTPLRSDTEIDADALARIVDAEYRRAGIDRSAIETGAVIITGETARKENAREVLSALSGYAGDFVVATAGPDLEGVLAGKGAGCGDYAVQHRVPVLNMDIGGGTANFCLFDAGGEPADTGCVNVGGRLVKMNGEGVITYVSPVLDGLCTLRPGQTAGPSELRPVIDLLGSALEETTGLRPRTGLSARLTTNRLPALNSAPPPLLCFSGGVADLIYTDSPPHWLAYGDIGVLLGRAVRESALFAAPHIQPGETIRATVIGAGSHATTLTGSTIAYEGVNFPLKNLPVLAVRDEEANRSAGELADTISRRLEWFWDGGKPEAVVVALHGLKSPSFDELERLADGLTRGLGPLTEAGLPLMVALEEDMGKALGQAMLCRMPEPRRLLCVDGLDLRTGTYLDVGRPVGSALPVVIKTLLMQAGG